MLMCYGLFVFSVHTAPFDSVQRSTEWRWPSNTTAPAANPLINLSGAVKTKSP